MTIPADVEAERLRLELRLRILEARDKAKASFIDFARYVWPEAIFSAHHQKMAGAFDRIVSGELKRLIINMPPRHAIMTSMNIPTTTGWKTMADLQVGDSVFGPDGLPTTVLGKSEVFRDRQLYKVTSDDGASLIVDGEHLWTVRLDRKRDIFHDYTTHELWRRQQGEVLRKTRGGKTEFLAGKVAKGIRLPRLPAVKAVQYEAKDLLIDPYVLGVWLGNGTSLSGIITSKDEDAVIIRREFERRGTRTTDQSTRYTFGTLGLQVKLKELGVLGNKHIPGLYLQTSVEQRMDLLRGLMDTDGNVAKNGQCFFAQSNLRFVEDVVKLIRSLGVKASVLESEAKIGDKSYGPSWKASFYMEDCCLLPRKRERLLGGERTFGRYIRVEKLGFAGDTQCIRVEREDGLFLAGDGYLCTHNTKSEFASYLLPSFAMGHEPRSKIIQATHNGELAVRFGRKVRNLMDQDNYKELFPAVSLKADSKAAGRWDTNGGGEYYACLRLHALVHTAQGLRPAGEIKPGDVLRNAGAWTVVREVYRTQHQQTYSVLGMHCSALHPVWTMNRGWVFASKLVPSDILAVESIWDKAKAVCRRFVSQKVAEEKEQPVVSGDVLRAYGDPEGLGWIRHQATRLIARGFSFVCQQQSGAQSYLAGIRGAAQKLQGLLLGVRTAGAVDCVTHDAPKPFVNFLTSGDHCFFAQGVLTHNCGVGGAMTGRGADLLIIDDPHSEQDALSELALDNAWEWYTSGPRSRLQPGGAVVVVMTRWGMKDLTARLIKAQVEPKSDQWEVIEFPAILNENTPQEKPLWPSYWSLDELQKVRATLSVQKWQSMYQQQPTNDEGAILKRDWWRIWENDYTPQVEYVIQSYDTAYSKKETADYSAITTWGVFRPSADDGPAIILLDVKKGRWDFPELKRVARAQYDHWKPDNVLIEAKATGTTLQQELRRVGIPVTTYSPGGRKKNQDKIARANAVAPVFESGMVWAPQTKWAEELIEECAAFPKGDNDDLVDSTVQAISRFRAGNFVALDDDEGDEPVTQLEFEYY